MCLGLGVVGFRFKDLFLFLGFCVWGFKIKGLVLSIICALL